jgi:hypothetical protein
VPPAASNRTGRVNVDSASVTTAAP